MKTTTADPYFDKDNEDEYEYEYDDDEDDTHKKDDKTKGDSRASDTEEAASDNAGITSLYRKLEQIKEKAEPKFNSVEKLAKNRPNSNSKVEKGTKSELPKAKSDGSSPPQIKSTKPPNSLGVVKPKNVKPGEASPSSVTKNPLLNNGGGEVIADLENERTGGGGNNNGSRSSEMNDSPPDNKAAAKSNSKNETDQAEYYDLVKDYKASQEDLNKIFNIFNDTDNKSRSAIEETAKSANLDESEKDSLIKDKKSDSLVTDIEKLGEETKDLEKQKHTSIMLNGRKFDQIEKVDCVDDKFYNLLMKDLDLVQPDKNIDYYGTYYDYEYAKAIGAIVDTPRTVQNNDNGKDSIDGNIIKNILDKIRTFWKETYDKYTKVRTSLDPKKLPIDSRKVKKKRAIANIKTKPAHQNALLNFQYLLQRLEELKIILFNGEESLIILNNRVKKLNQAIGEDELQSALCNCIISRAGRSALMLMNELFVDKDSEEKMKDLKLAKKKGEDAALDTAEFCSYWYGDTLRSQAIQKEKQIKRLVYKVKKFSYNKTSIKTTKTTEVVEEGSKITIKKTRIKVVKTIIQMTTYWLPRLANWIKEQLTETTSENFEKEEKEEIHHMEKRSLIDNNFQEELNGDDTFSTPFDNLDNYYDVDDEPDLESSSILQSFINNNYFLSDRRGRRFKRELLAAKKKKEKKKKLIITTTTTKPTSSISNEKQKLKKISHDIGENLKPSSYLSSKKPDLGISKKISTTRIPDSSKTTKIPDNIAAKSLENEPEFEQRISNKTSKCAIDGFGELLRIAFEQNSLMYESNTIDKDNKYIVTMRDSFIKSFQNSWIHKRNEWSKSLDNNINIKDKNNNNKTDERSVDEQIDNSFESTGSSYDRGVKLGYTIGKFIGDKSTKQWPDPAELNTFTYDSLFLAGIGSGYNEEDSKLLERRIVVATVRRVAFTEANRASFGKTLHTAYLKGTLMAPNFGILHTQRSISKQTAKEGNKVGFEASARAADEFTPKAVQFFKSHQHQRELAAPYKRAKHLTDMWAGVAEQINEVRESAELNKNLSSIAVDCGQKAGTLMGALMGIIVTPEAFETYIRVRGSLEALESEFNQFKLGAMRGYELGESWAYLNYTAQLNKNLKAMKTKFGKQPTTNGDDGNDDFSSNSRAKITKPTTTDSVVDSQKKLELNSGSKSLFDQKAGANKEDGGPNMDSIFQFMVLNYGTHLIANHSRKHMLKVRASELDETIIRDIKLQAGDLVADPPKMSDLDRKNGRNDSNDDLGEKDDIFESGPFAGELKGEFSSAGEEKKKPIKFNIIDLGPMLEFNDKITPSSSSESSSSSNENNKKESAALAETPLTEALSKVGKIFMKFSVARKKKKAIKTDDVALYLNADYFDQGDGYLCGTYSQLRSHLSSGNGNVNSNSSSSELQQLNSPQSSHDIEDDFGLEIAMLDELFSRIEKAGLDVGTVSLVDKVMSMTTIAPKRIEKIAGKIPAKAVVSSSVSSSEHNSKESVAVNVETHKTPDDTVPSTAATTSTTTSTTTTTTSPPTTKEPPTLTPDPDSTTAAPITTTESPSIPTTTSPPTAEPSSSPAPSSTTTSSSTTTEAPSTTEVPPSSQITTTTTTTAKPDTPTTTSGPQLEGGSSRIRFPKIPIPKPKPKLPIPKPKPKPPKPPSKPKPPSNPKPPKVKPSKKPELPDIPEIPDIPEPDTTPEPEPEPDTTPEPEENSDSDTTSEPDSDSNRR